MMKVKKETARKILASVLALSMIGSVASFAPLTVMAQTPDSQVEGTVNPGSFIYEEKDDGTIKITGFDFEYGYSYGYSGYFGIEIPSQIDGKTVTEIGYSFLNQCNYVRSVVLPETITSLEDDAFYRLGGLESINIPSSVKTIGRSAFEDCTSLKSIELPEGLEIIENDTFYDCSSLTSITIPASVKTI